MLATEKSKAKAPPVPPTKEPRVPEYVIGLVTVGADVATFAKVFVPEK